MDLLSSSNILMAPLYHLELVRDRDIPYDGNLRTTEQAAEVLHRLLDSSPVEQLVVIYLDSGTKIIGAERVGMGGVEQVGAHPAEVFRGAIVKSAPEIIISHNHIDGVVQPSPHDMDYTMRMVQYGAMLGIRVRDHIIVGPGGKHMSMREHTDSLARELEAEFKKSGIEGIKQKLMKLLDPTGKGDLDVIVDQVPLPGGMPKKGGDPKANVLSDWKDTLSYELLSRLSR